MGSHRQAAIGQLFGFHLGTDDASPFLKMREKGSLATLHDGASARWSLLDNTAMQCTSSFCLGIENSIHNENSVIKDQG